MIKMEKNIKPIEANEIHIFVIDVMCMYPFLISISIISRLICKVQLEKRKALGVLNETFFLCTHSLQQTVFSKNVAFRTGKEPLLCITLRPLSNE